ncbi:MAG: hypothetical protein WBC21_04330 [Minisyncoccales bacterium]
MNILNFLKSENYTSLLKYMLMGAIGFGIGCTIWGFLLFQETLSSTHRLMNPFSYIMASIVLGSIGGLFLALPFKDIKKILLSFILGGVGFFIAFLIGLISSYHLFFLGHYFLDTLLILTDTYKWNFLFSLHQSLIIGEFVFVFAIVGAIGGFFYSIALKKKVKSMVLAGMFGFAIGSLIGPLVGNFTEMIFESLLAAYITTFLTIGIITGISFGIGMYFAEKSNVSKQKI